MPSPKKNIRILSMDLSLSGAAFAVLDVFEKSVKIVEMRLVDNTLPQIKSKSHGEKLANIYFNLDEMLNKHKATDFVREKGFSRFPLATQTLFKVVGVVDFTLYCNEIKESIEEIAPTSVKKLVTGDGKADKAMVDKELRKYLAASQKDIVFEQDDLSDAVAVGIAYALKNKLLPVYTPRQRTKKDVE